MQQTGRALDTTNATSLYTYLTNARDDTIHSLSKAIEAWPSQLDVRITLFAILARTF